jgi:hypothetical protein
MREIRPFPRVWCKPVYSCCVTETVRQIVAVFDSGQPLHLWKRHPCTSPVWRQLTDWREQVTTWMRWPVWAVVQSQRHCVFNNTVEPLWTAAINKHINTCCAILFDLPVECPLSVVSITRCCTECRRRQGNSVCVLFNDAVCSSDYTASNNRMINE